MTDVPRCPSAGAWLLLGVLAAACDTTPVPTAPTPPRVVTAAADVPAPTVPPPTPAPPPPRPLEPGPVTRYRVSGRVVDDLGRPVPAARVQATFEAPGWVHPPPAECTPTAGCSMTTQSDASGTYRFEFDAQLITRGPFAGDVGYLTANAPGHSFNLQRMPGGWNPLFQDLRLARERQVAVGESVRLRVHADSSLCVNVDYLWAFDKRCEGFLLVTDVPGVFVVEAGADDGQVPLVDVFGFAQCRPAGGGDVVHGAVQCVVRAGPVAVWVGVSDGGPHDVDVRTYWIERW